MHSEAADAAADIPRASHEPIAPRTGRLFATRRFLGEALALLFERSSPSSDGNAIVIPAKSKALGTDPADYILVARRLLAA
jgi:hypothetical protein